MSIYYVRMEGTKAELEIDADNIRCMSGDTTHWSTPRGKLLLAEQTGRDTILLNFFDDRQELVQARIRSKNCLSIMRDLTVNKS